ncbi:MAG TPA: hypothetical protein VHH88_13585, partial [Verrucomicrobiae bacterium]|nr:hypothetical protein [Verrucomicrobiae bacterium]
MMTLLRYLLGQCRPAWRLTTAGAGMRPLDFLGKPVLVPFPGRPKTQFHIFHQAENAGSDSSERAPRPQVSASDFSRDGSGQSEAPKRAIRVAIVEDESTVRENLAALLKGAPD